jgi:hypothetical protein
MTTSTKKGKSVKTKFDVGSMYEYNDMIVICCHSDEDVSFFSGVIVYMEEKNINSLSEYKIGKYYETFMKFYFVEFEGEVTLKS